MCHEIDLCHQGKFPNLDSFNLWRISKASSSSSWFPTFTGQWIDGGRKSEQTWWMSIIPSSVADLFFHYIQSLHIFFQDDSFCEDNFHSRSFKMPEKWFKTSGYPPSRSRAGWGMMRRPKGSRRYGSVCILKMDPIASTYTDTESDKTLLHDFETLVFLSGVLMYRIIKQFDRAQSEVFQQLKSLKVTQKATPVFLVLMHLDCFFFFCNLLLGYKECLELFWTPFCDRVSSGLKS